MSDGPYIHMLHYTRRCEHGMLEDDYCEVCEGAADWHAFQHALNLDAEYGPVIHPPAETPS